MTLEEFFALCTENPVWIVAFYLFLPIAALVAGIIGRGEGHLSPFKYLYSILIYAAAIPGIFAVTLNIYLFLFEQRSILQTDIYTQILPVISMIATLVIINRNVDLVEVPGFDRLGGLLGIIFVALGIMWVLDRTRILFATFSYMPFIYVILIFAGLMLVLSLGARYLFRD